MIKTFKNVKELNDYYKKTSETGNYYDHPKAIEEESKLYLDKDSTKPTAFKKYYFRSIIYPKDIAAIYGDDSPLFAHELFMKIWEATGTRIGSAIYDQAFCKYTGLDDAVLKLFIHESYTEVYNQTFKQLINIVKEVKLRGNVNDPLALYKETGDYYDLPDVVEQDLFLYLDMNSPESKKHDSNFQPRYEIYPRDIEIILGDDSPHFARYIMMEIRKNALKPLETLVTYTDFCDYTGMDLETVINFILES